MTRQEHEPLAQTYTNKNECLPSLTAIFCGSDLFSWKVPETHPKLWKEIITRKKDQPGQCQSTIHVSDLEIPRGKKISTKVKLKEMRGGMDKMGLKQALKTKPCILSLQSLEELGLMLTSNVFVGKGY